MLRFASGFHPTRPHGKGLGCTKPASSSCSCLRLMVTSNGFHKGLTPSVIHPCPTHPPAFRLGVLLPSLRLCPALALTFRRLPAFQFPLTIRLSAVALVVPPGLEPPAAPLPQAVSPPQSSPTGRDTLACRNMRTSHGKACSLGAARGGLPSSSGTYPSPFDPTSPCHSATACRFPLAEHKDIESTMGALRQKAGSQT